MCFVIFEIYTYMINITKFEYYSNTMRIIRFLKATVKYIRFGQQTTIDVYIDRLTICKNCNNFDNEKWSCKICGCYLDKKAKMNTENCPEDKW